MYGASLPLGGIMCRQCVGAMIWKPDPPLCEGCLASRFHNDGGVVG
jgi:hypothetical protein